MSKWSHPHHLASTSLSNAGNIREEALKGKMHYHSYSPKWLVSLLVKDSLKSPSSDACAAFLDKTS